MSTQESSGGVVKPAEKKTEWICGLCNNLSFRRYATYYSHKRAKHIDGKIMCAHCSIKLRTIQLRNSHYYRAMNPIVEKPVAEKPVKAKNLWLKNP